MAQFCAILRNSLTARLPYVQGIKGLLTVYNREIAAQKAAFAFRNQLLTFGVLLVVVIVVWFLVITATLADPSQLWQRNRGEEYMRPYYQRRDVHAFLWAVGGTLVYYTAAILVFFLICNLLGHRYWDASRTGRIHTRSAPQLSHLPRLLYRYWDASMPCSPETTITFIMVRIFPTCWVTPSTASLTHHTPILRCASSLRTSSRGSSAARTCTTTGGWRRTTRTAACAAACCSSASRQSSLRS